MISADATSRIDSGIWAWLIAMMMLFLRKIAVTLVLLLIPANVAAFTGGSSGDVATLVAAVARLDSTIDSNVSNISSIERSLARVLAQLGTERLL